MPRTSLSAYQLDIQSVMKVESYQLRKSPDPLYTTLSDVQADTRQQYELHNRDCNSQAKVYCPTDMQDDESLTTLADVAAIPTLGKLAMLDSEYR